MSQKDKDKGSGDITRGGLIDNTISQEGEIRVRW